MESTLTRLTTVIDVRTEGGDQQAKNYCKNLDIVEIVLMRDYGSIKP